MHIKPGKEYKTRQIQLQILSHWKEKYQWEGWEGQSQGMSQWNLFPASAAVVKEVLSYQLSIVMIALSSSLCCDVRLPAEMTSHSYNWASVVIRFCWEEINNFDGSPSDQTQIIILQSQDISCSCYQLYKPQLWLFIFTMAKLTLLEVHQEI